MSDENVMHETIYAHDIAYWWDDNEERELSEIDIEHIQGCLRENYVAGELCQYDTEEDIEYRGWWEIN